MQSAISSPYTNKDVSAKRLDNSEVIPASSVNMIEICKAEEDQPFGSAAATEGVELKKLPTLATANDVRELVQYLKRRPEGINLFDVPQPSKKRTFCKPKIAAYESWGLVEKKGDR